MMSKIYRSIIGIVLTTTLFSAVGYSIELERIATARPIIWQNPGNIAQRDLTYGPGSPELAPQPPFVFIEEDKGGESPKFKVRDAGNTLWTVKLGPEAQTETVASRLLWAVGYFAEEAYYLHRAEIQNLPRLSRGREHVEAGRFVNRVRFEPRRDYIKRGDTWKWLKNPFVGTREFEGLKVLMVLINNYDTSPANNRIFRVTDPATGMTSEHYAVADLGASFGSVGGLGGHRSKNNLYDFRRSRFIKRARDGIVQFDYDTTPKGLGYLTFVFSPGYWRSQADKEKAMKGVRLDHARWIGGLLSQITDRQFDDAFAAAGYTPTLAAGFTGILRSRIRQLNTVTSVRPRSNRRRGV
jgi:hypothetical protein